MSQSAYTLECRDASDLSPPSASEQNGAPAQRRSSQASHRDAGYDVVGAALARKAADTLQQKAGIHSRTLHRRFTRRSSSPSEPSRGSWTLASDWAASQVRSRHRITASHKDFAVQRNTVLETRI